MQALSKGRGNASVVVKVVETMALYKMDLIRCLKLMNARERALNFENSILKTKTPIADKVIADYLAENPGKNYRIVCDD